MADTKKTQKKPNQPKDRPSGKPRSSAAKPATKKRRGTKPDPDATIRPHFYIVEDLLALARERAEEAGLGSSSVPHIVRIGLTMYVEEHADSPDGGQVIPEPLAERLRELADAAVPPKDAEGKPLYSAPRATVHEYDAYLAAMREAGYSLTSILPIVGGNRQRLHQRADAGLRRAEKSGTPLPELEIYPAGADIPKDVAMVDRSFPMKRHLYQAAKSIADSRGDAISNVVNDILWDYVNGKMAVAPRSKRTTEVLDALATPQAG